MKIQLLSLLVSLLFTGCGSNKPLSTETESYANQNEVTPETSQASSAPVGFAPKLKGECREGYSDGEYGCDMKKGNMCPSMMNDVRGMEGFHVVSIKQCDCGKHPAYVHVADTCMHYFCGINAECLEQGGTAESCMVGTGCMIVHKL